MDPRSQLRSAQSTGGRSEVGPADVIRPGYAAPWSKLRSPGTNLRGIDYGPGPVRRSGPTSTKARSAGTPPAIAIGIRIRPAIQWHQGRLTTQLQPVHSTLLRNPERGNRAAIFR